MFKPPKISRTLVEPAEDLLQTSLSCLQKKTLLLVAEVVYGLILIMLYLVGLGLADETDVTVKGLEVVKKADRVYLEAYTSILLVDKTKLVRVRQVWY